MNGENFKTVMQKSFDSLVGKITCKIFGKTTKLYFAKQDGKEVTLKEQLIEMD